MPQGVFAPGARGEQARGVQLESGQVAVARDRVMLGPVTELAQGTDVGVHVGDDAYDAGRAVFIVAADGDGNAAPEEGSVPPLEAQRCFHFR